MKEQDAAHSFDYEEQIKKAEDEIIRLQSENKGLGKMYANTAAKLRDLQKEFSDTKANLHRAYNGLENYNKTKDDLTRLRSELQQKDEENKIILNKADELQQAVDKLLKGLAKDGVALDGFADAFAKCHEYVKFRLQYELDNIKAKLNN